ncbi:hypothetical protein MKQ68_00995 [Chitinophaga horti]|uniref:Uncharacterized protein n=1 Tax=Chitinophaga horti TaxID=2920382 RepID=A0ABY6J600_9BACT|nr:hypothetical protein [Chitinophaga horti]UYQ93677.1 hypothetical protein MKQ68_00995 [Chitinophaga horti]
MKKYLLLSLMAAAGIMACGKDDAKETVNTANPDALTSATKVYYGALVDGNIAEWTAGGPVIYRTEDDSTLQRVVLAGGYMVLDVEADAASDVTGYLVQIEGAKSHFRIDYTKPRGARKAPASGLFKTQEAADSQIVIKLPENAKDGEFCVKAAAYNADGKVGNSIKYCVTVSKAGNNSALSGTWYRTGEYDSEKEKWSTKYDSSVSNIFCVENKLTWICPPGQNCQGPDVLWGLKIDSSTFVFSADGKLVLQERRRINELDLEASTCSNLKYTSRVAEEAAQTVYWSYDATGKKLLLTTDPANDQEWMFTTMGLEINGNKLILTEAGGDKQEYTKK